MSTKYASHLSCDPKRSHFRSAAPLPVTTLLPVSPLLAAWQVVDNFTHDWKDGVAFMAVIASIVNDPDIPEQHRDPSINMAEVQAACCRDLADLGGHINTPTAYP